MESNVDKSEIEYDSENINLNPDFLSKYVAAGRVSINRNVIAKCLEFCEIPLLNYFIGDSKTHTSRDNYLPHTSDQFSQHPHQIDTLSWCSHQIDMEGLNMRGQNESHSSRPYYDSVNKLARFYREKPPELPSIDYNQITLPPLLEELLCTIGICCKYYIADCLKKAQEDAFAQGTTVITARHIYEAARKCNHNSN